MKYQLAKSFYEENGHLKVPTCEIELSNWLIKQRQAYKTKSLTIIKFICLKK